MVLVLAAMMACKGELDTTPGDPDPTGTSETGTTDVPTGVVREPITISFLPDVFDEEVSCSSEMDLLSGAPGDAARLVDLRFFVSDVDVLAVDGSPLPVYLTPNAFQTEDVALLDFEDGSANCVGGTPEMHKSIEGEVSPGTYNGLEFTLGVPFGQNHALGEAPLDAPGLFVGNQVGHRHFRVALLIDDTETWSTELHSMDCASGGPDEAPVDECERPATARIRIENIDPASQAIRLRIGGLMIDNDEETPYSPLGCVSDPSESVECTVTYEHFGMDWETGLCEDDCQAQDLFRLF